MLRALRAALPREDFVYLGDTARLPYGTKAAATVQRYAEQAAGHLTSIGVKAVVVACNTAAGIALPHLARTHPDLLIFGVVRPGADAAAMVADEHVLVLATESTVLGGAYQRALLHERAELRVHARACPLWVTLAEQGGQDSPLVRTILEDSLRGFAASPAGLTLLLGCTHFPVFRPVLEALRPDWRIVDSASTTAAAVAEGLAAAALLKEGTAPGQVQWLATDGLARFQRIGGYFYGEAISGARLVDL